MPLDDKRLEELETEAGIAASIRDPGPHDEVLELVEEVRRLRAALREIADGAPCNGIWCGQKAAAALGRAGPALEHYWPTYDELADARLGDQAHAAVRRAQAALEGCLVVILAAPPDATLRAVYLPWVAYFLGVEVLELSGSGDVVVRRG